MTYRIDAGDAVYFDANTVHSYVCTGKAPATAVIVTLQHPQLLQLGSSSRALHLGNGKVRSVPAAVLPATTVARKNSERMQ
jgi:hypothetical protein